MCTLYMHMQLSFDDIAKFGGVYGEKHSALASLQSNLQSAGSALWTGMHGRVASDLVSMLFFNYDVTPNNVIGRCSLICSSNVLCSYINNFVILLHTAYLYQREW